MPRQIPWGSPSRSIRMLIPRSGQGLLLYSVAGGSALLVLITAFYLFGARRSVSPGPLARAHHEINAKCSQCHDEGNNVADVRCARCHDQSAVGRVEHASHVLLGSGDVAKAAEAPAMACATCHTDHRGEAFMMRSVDDRECATCHKNEFSALLKLRPLTSFQNHPEFAVAKAQRTTGIGLIFSHLTHYDYVIQEQRGLSTSVPVDDARTNALQTCERCHTRDQATQDIEPIRFDLGCAGSKCHTDGTQRLKDSTDVVSLKYLGNLTPANVVIPPSEEDADGRVYSSLSHRDPWVLFAAASFRTAIDPVGTAAEREALRASVAWLEQQVGQPVLFAGMSVDDLRAWERALATQVAADAARPDGNDPAALSRAVADIQDVLAKLAAATGQPPPPASPDDDAAAALASSTRPNDPDASARFNDRKAELLRLVAAVRARATSAGDANLAKRADDLQGRIDRVNAQPATTDDPAALRRYLDGLDEVFKLARRTADPQVQAELATLQGLRDSAGTRGLGGLDPRDFEQRRQEISRLLDTLRQSPNADVRQKAIELGGRLATLGRAVRPGDAARRQADSRRWLDRVHLEIELQTSRDGPTPAPTPLRERAFAQTQLEQRRADLSLLDNAAATTSLAGDEAVNAGAALTSLLKPCLKCHLFDGEDESRIASFSAPPDLKAMMKRNTADFSTRKGLRLAPVGAAEPIMKRATFKHRPHLAATNCVTCHASAISGERPVPELPGALGARTIGSTLAIDLNSPGVATCQTCHKSSGARQDCAVCHVYHPPSAERLLRSVWSPN